MGSLSLRQGTPSSLLATYLDRRADFKRLLAARLGCPQEAEDLVQEMYLKLTQLDAGLVVERHEAFLYRMAMNLALDRVRQRRRGSARDRQWIDATSQMAEGEAIEPQPLQDRVVDGRQRLARVMDAAQRLPSQCKRVFQLHKIEGLSHAEVADMLGISRSAVEKQMTTALQRLTKAQKPALRTGGEKNCGGIGQPVSSKQGMDAPARRSGHE
jgi:RNA polymerase sigma factor (sigma-70 family)